MITFGKRYASAVESTVGGGNGDLEYFRCFICRKIKHIPQNQDRTLARWQILQSGHKRKGNALAVRIARLGVEGGRVTQPFIWKGFQPGHLWGRRQDRRFGIRRRTRFKRKQASAASLIEKVQAG